MRKASAAVLAVGVAISAMGCGAVGKPFVAGPSDFASYRATRVAKSLDEKMTAASRYLEEHPEGIFASEVANFFEAAEPLYFEVRKGTKAGLFAYLEALPDGPHAAEARERIRVFERRERR